MHTDFKGYGVEVTEDGTVRLRLVLDSEPSELWKSLFEAANRPATDELMDQYVVHGVNEAEDGTYVFIDLKAQLPTGSAYRALDWLQATTDAVDRQVGVVEDEVRRLTRIVGEWYRRNVDAST